MRPTLLRIALGIAVAMALLTACSHPDDESGPAVGSSLSGDTIAPPTAASLPVSAPGTGAIALGALVYEFSVTKCQPQPEPESAASSRRIFSLEGKGKGRADAPFTIEITRYQTKATEVTFTDTITYRDNARIFQAQRYEVAGVVTDPRDPEAETPLLSIDGTHVVGAGGFSAPGEKVEDAGVLAGRIDASCVA